MYQDPVEVAGTSYVATALAGGASYSSRPMQELVTEVCRLVLRGTKIAERALLGIREEKDRERKEEE